MAEVFTPFPACTILANLSGGIDSVYGVYTLLRQGEHVLIHHCQLSEYRRATFECAANAEVLEWYTSQGLDNFEYVESTVTMPPARHASRVRDGEILMFLAGGLLRSHKHIKRMAYFNNAEDSSSRYPRYARRLVSIMRRTARRQNIRVIRPIANMTKAEVVAAIPPELLALCHWCRFPRVDGSPCHRCHTCKSVDPALALLTE